MNRARCQRDGFTLTEILMAVGVLTIGLTMVATVFPVAIDQNRRSYDLTQASLCARNVAATMRLKRSEVLKMIRGTTDNTKVVQVANVPLNNVTALPEKLIDYDPKWFLYNIQTDTTKGTSWDRTYENVVSHTATVPDWNAGQFRPRVYIARVPVVATGTTAPLWAARGPYRVSIVVFRSRGRDPGTSMAAGTADSVVAGDYVVDMTMLLTQATPTPTAATVTSRGEAYLVDHVDGTRYVVATAGLTQTTTAPGTTYGKTDFQTGTGPATTAGQFGAEGQHGAVIAFHTFFGD